MTKRGLISPPRAFSGPNNAAANPPMRPNYRMSPPPRPTTVVNPSEQMFYEHWLKATSSSNAIRATHIAPPNPYDLQNHQKKLDHNNNNNSSTKTTAPPPTRHQRLRNGATLISNNTAPRPKGPTASGSRSDPLDANLIAPKFSDSPNNSSPNHLSIHGSGQRQNISNVGNNGGTAYTSLAHPQLNNHLHKLSRGGSGGNDGKIPIYGGQDDHIVLHSKCSSQSNVPRIFEIYKDIASHRQGNSSITSYFTRLKTLWDELETYNDLSQCCSSGEHVEREKVMQFLVGLNDPYSTICHQILLIRPFPTVEKAYSIVIREEKRMWS
ncbi:uncharacterized protein LOC111008934 isoform X2 [Momordica charantia]|uniref:Uncharacterized protein LOC111008934 isoform X2 n=1 Tax=Momordica charantia TaxID=3673 RepID=A0A6J1C6T8_MOMCH|nr:uncharacterized protein LOC111008934 isoform X2 [Momordica charantia]